MDGTVTHMAKFGAFVALEPGIEGLVHLSELAEGDFGDASNVVSEGESLSLVVLSVDAGRHRIGLSLKRVTDDDPRDFSDAAENESRPPDSVTGETRAPDQPEGSVTPDASCAEAPDGGSADADSGTRPGGLTAAK